MRPRIVNEVAAVGAMVIAACVSVGCSDSSGSSDANAETGTEGDPTNSCGLSVLGGVYQDPFSHLTGKATRTAGGETTEWKELTCETIRDTNGAAVGYTVAFADESVDLRKMVSFDVTGYEGDGIYDGVYVDNYAVKSYYLEREGTEKVTLEITQNGKHGVATSADGSYAFTYDCDSTDDTTTAKAAPPAALVPGTAQVVSKDGRVYHFDALVCTWNPINGEVRISAPDVMGYEPLRLSFVVEKSASGEYSTKIDFQYFEQVSSYQQGTVTLNCGNQVSGSFSLNDYSEKYTGTFICPTD